MGNIMLVDQRNADAPKTHYQNITLYWFVLEQTSEGVKEAKEIKVSQNNYLIVAIMTVYASNWLLNFQNYQDFKSVKTIVILQGSNNICASNLQMFKII